MKGQLTTCSVEGCLRRGPLVDVWLTGDTGSDEVLAGRIETTELRVCAIHAHALGDVEDVDYGFGDTGQMVRVKREKAEGWRIVSIVRATGRWDVVLYPPPRTTVPHEPDVEHAPMCTTCGLPVARNAADDGWEHV